ncbi:GroES-like protein [Teratosphaeria destructans]|uniref:GroES-like protein n=1 Tax=Teratosphaeria destructans TaxID=418781 RepID=A0A9W7SIE7_9PEZI|nr:GroES-like protein [Teratosphaeria destructans]
MPIDQNMLPKTQQAIKVVESSLVRLEDDVPLPDLEEDFVLVRVHCVALNPFDWKSLDLSPSPGATFGCDVSGEVVAIGSKCGNSFQLGDRVFGPVEGNSSDTPDNGGFAQYAAIREVVAWKVPHGMSFEHAATLGMALVTVGLALHNTLKMPFPSTSSESDGAKPFVFIYGGGTATGTMAVQCTALSGMKPIVACSSRHFQRLSSLGAVACFDYHLPNIADEIRAFTNDSITATLDCITDSASMSLCYATLGNQGGRYVGLDQFPIRCHTRRDVRPDWIIAWTVSGKAVPLRRPYKRAPRPRHRMFGEKWKLVAQRLLDDNVIQTHPADIRSGGLAAIPEGVELLRKGKVQGKKLVYPIM